MNYNVCCELTCTSRKVAGMDFCAIHSAEQGKSKLGGKGIDIVKKPNKEKYTFRDCPSNPHLAEVTCNDCGHAFRIDPDWHFTCPECTKEDKPKADRFDDNKPMLQYNLLGREVCELEASVWTAGAEKYSPGNWLKGQSTTKAAGSLLRHLTAYLAGEDNDPESGLPHIGHVITSAKILANGQLKGFDDRSKG